MNGQRYLHQRYFGATRKTPIHFYEQEKKTLFSSIFLPGILIYVGTRDYKYVRTLHVMGLF